MHSMGIVHRDLKPENAIVRNTGELVLVDLACAKKIGKEGRTSTVLGSPHYMAPEVIKGKQYTLSVDYWALGVILYEFVSGKLPFGNDLEDTYAIFEKILEKPVVYQNSISQQARTLLSLLLEKDGENRIRSQK